MDRTENVGLTCIEGCAEIDSARLSYRLVNPDSTGPTLVFENGWGASWHYWVWLERAMADSCRMLFYDRAGIGGSTVTGDLSVAGITRNFVALLRQLEIKGTVIAVGHSFGGLMVGLHAAVAPDLVSKVIQLDPTPELDDPAIDKQLAAVKIVGRIAQACALLGMPDPIFSGASDLLPGEQGRQLQKQSFGNSRSLRNAIAEIALIPGMRVAISGSPATATRPLLVVSAGEATVPKTGFWRLFVNNKKALGMQQAMKAIHQAQARSSSNGRWDSVPFAHGEMVFTEAGANATAQKIMAEISDSQL